MPGIFLSYRNIERSWAPMLVDRELSRRFGPENVFQAGRSNLPAVHFPTEIDRRVDKCDLLIALIDRPWVGEDLHLLRDSGDWVRREIARALGQGKRVLPVLLDGAEMPRTAEVPDDIAPLTRKIALRMRPRTVDTDLLRLIGEVERLVPELVLATLMDPAPPKNVGGPALLRAEHQVLPFRHRGELDLLAKWFSAPAGPPVKLVVGALGAGKTRLGLRLAAQVRGSGRPAGLLSMTAPAECLERLGEIGSPCLVVLDDAEVRPAQVRAALRSLAAAPDAPARLLLLARSGGDWLDDLRDDADDAVADLVDSIVPLSLAPLRPAEEDFATACTAFARHLGLPLRSLPSDRPETPTLLELQAAALTHVLSPDTPLDRPLRRILGLERAYWRKVGTAFGLPEPSDRVLAEVMAAVTLFGADSEPEADGLLASLRAFRGGPVQAVDSCRDLLRAVLPGTGPLNPLQPEQLAQEFVADFLDSDHRLAELLDGVSDEQARRALRNLGRYLERHPRISGSVEDFLAAAPGRLLPLALTVLPSVPQPQLLVSAMSGALGRTPQGELLAVVDALPLRSDALARFAVDATERALGARDADAGDFTTARLARRLSVRLTYLGERPSDAAEAARSAVRTLTALTVRGAAQQESVTAGSGPGSVAGELAEAHAALALALDLDPSRRDEAVAVGETAVAQYRALPDRDRHGAALATALHNQSIRLRRVRAMPAALAAAAEARRLVEPLHAERPTRFRSLYADVLDNLSIVTHLTGHPDEAERLGRETLALRRALAAARPDAYRSQLAGTLFNLGLLLTENERKGAEARRLWGESLSIYETLSVHRPGYYDEARDRVRAHLDRRKADHDD
ncbi:TIR domain-containing protein [Streptomyces sp. MBT33]|uniref:TIR domain-containing protein n=1 Tax=Streptomyces sp. MBT33 TaxID=1488363 RepID=UPI0019091335|nr:TIR domain-containing protein [Streptomyces sp. MBT33]MBK3644585.1 toll/interleukin-1 receptor domain-containing protein [Streptomyces sp. MBT33]